MPLKPLIGTQRVSNPARPSVPTAGTECCVAVGQPTLRSVHRECAGRVIEPRNFSSRGGRRCLSSGRHHLGARRHHTKVPPGSESRACMYWGSPGTWETLSSPPRNPGGGAGDSTGPCLAALGRASERTIKRSAVSEGEGNEAQGDGWQGVGALHSTEESGEPSPKGPRRGKGAP